jgi:hypothetical protein
MLWHPKLDRHTDTSTSDTPTSIAHPLSSEDIQEQPSVLGILSDSDIMASELTKSEVPNSAALHRIGILSSMPMMELLPSPPSLLSPL